MSQAYLKLTHQEAVVKLWGNGIDDTIQLLDLVSNNQVLSGDEYEVNIVGVTWTGSTDSIITIERDGETIMTLPCSQAGNSMDLSGQQIPPDTINNYSDIYVQSTGNAQLYLTLRKKVGYKSTVEYAQYGSYDNETIVGPLTINGAPPPEGLFDLPLPGSGSYVTDTEVDSTAVGTPYAPGGDVSSIVNEAAGLWRKKFQGNFGPGPGGGIDVNFCRTTPSWFGKADTFVGFGSQDLSTENNYTLEWVGYFKAPATDTYNFYVTCDDDTYMWIGPSALDDNNGSGNAILVASNETYYKVNDSVELVEGQYYPVRIQFGEYSGAERMQIFWSKSDSNSYGYAGDNLTHGQVWFHDSVAKGHTPL